MASMQSSLPRALYLPPPGRPRWVCPESMKLNLQYLSWGKRQYHANPVPVSLHHGWLYVLVLTGNPILRTPKGTHRTVPREVLLIGPDFASGWTMASNRDTADMLAWTWYGPPCCSALGTAENSFKTFIADQSLIRAMQRNHALCRAEVEKPDTFSAVALDGLRARLDVNIARHLCSSSTAPEPAMRLEFAIGWLSQNMAQRRPVSALCEYLQISPVTLNRLFQAHLQESVAAYFLRIRMERARQLLETGQATIKETAFAMGFKHPNDFTRAFKKFTGKNPSELLWSGHIVH